MTVTTAGSENIVIVGAGRMGRGLAQVFAYAGRPVAVIDMKPRDHDDFQTLKDSARAEIDANLRFFVSLGVMNDFQADAAIRLVSVWPAADAATVLGKATMVVEGVPETHAAKAEALAAVGALAPANAIVASTTSSMLVTELQGLISHPERFLNTHFLNPAYLIPLVEVSPGPATDEAVVAHTMQLYKDIGKVPVRCAPSPGYIVPRLQALLMSEACRMVEEGVATAEELDKAVTHGFGPRYTTMGILEFVDWGGVDILYYGGNYLAKALNSPRHAPPAEVEQMMKDGRKGMREGRGYYDYRTVDVEAYQREKIGRFVMLLQALNQLPRSALPAAP